MRKQIMTPSPQAIEHNPSGQAHFQGQILALGMKTWSMDVLVRVLCAPFIIYHLAAWMPSSDKPLNSSVQQVQMGLSTSVSAGAHLMIKLVDHLKHDHGPGCQAWPTRLLRLSSKAQQVGCQKGLASGM